MRGGRWPEVVGVTAVVDDKRVVVVGSRGPHYLYLYDGRVGALPRRRLRPEPGGANAAILAQALATQVNDKSSVRRERGTFAPQLVQRGADPPTLYLYEAGYFGTLFPRWKWVLPGHPISAGTPAALWSAIVAEASRRELAALPDERQPATVAAEFPDAGPPTPPLYGVGFPQPASKFADVRCPACGARRRGLLYRGRTSTGKLVEELAEGDALECRTCGSKLMVADEGGVAIFVKVVADD